MPLFRVLACLLGAGTLAGDLVAQAAAPAASRAVSNRLPNVKAQTERVASDRVRLAITPEAAARGNLKLLDDSGHELVANWTSAGALEAVVDPRRSYMLTPPSSSRHTLSDDGMHFPARYVTIRPDGVARVGGLFLRPARVPLIWSETERAYVTDLFVGYEFPDGAENDLKEPKTVTFFAEGAGARIHEDRVRVTRSGGGGYQRVTLFTAEVEHETNLVARASAQDELKASVGVLREPGALQLSLPSREIPAFGVGSATLAITLLARDGRPLAPERAFEVQLSSRRLRLPASVTLPAGRSSVDVELRSLGQGADEIVARGGALPAVTQPVQLVFPVAPIVAAVIAGALGGAARCFRRKSRPRGLLLRRAVEGVLVGVILVGAAWAGLVAVNVGSGVLGTPFGAFVLAALGGYVGTALLDRVARRTFALKPGT